MNSIDELLEGYSNLSLLNKVINYRLENDALQDRLTIEEIEIMEREFKELNDLQDNKKHEDLLKIKPDTADYSWFFGGDCDCEKCGFYHKTEIMSRFLNGILLTGKVNPEAYRLIPESLTINSDKVPEISITNSPAYARISEGISKLGLDTFKLTSDDYKTLAKEVSTLSLGFKEGDLIKHLYSAEITESEELIKSEKEEDVNDWLEGENQGIIKNNAGYYPTNSLIKMINIHNYFKLKKKSIPEIIKKDYYNEMKTTMLGGSKLLSEYEVLHITSYENMIDCVWNGLNNNPYNIWLIPTRELMKIELDEMNGLEGMKGLLKESLENGQGNARTLMKLLLVRWSKQV